jgi:hypothetical protein
VHTRPTRLEMRKNKPATDQKPISREKRLRGVEICRLCVNWRPQTSACAAHCSSSRLRDELQIWQKPSAPDIRPVKLVHRSLTSSQGDRLQHLEPLHDVDPHDIVMEHDNSKKVPHTVALRAAHHQKKLSSSETQDAAVPGSDRCEPMPVAN